jgi:hypothetical protein
VGNDGGTRMLCHARQRAPRTRDQTLDLTRDLPISSAGFLKPLGTSLGTSLGTRPLHEQVF